MAPTAGADEEFDSWQPQSDEFPAGRKGAVGVKYNATPAASNGIPGPLRTVVLMHNGG